MSEVGVRPQCGHPRSPTRDKAPSANLPLHETLGLDQQLGRAIFQLIYDAKAEGIDQREILLRLRKTMRPMLTIEEVRAAVKSLVRLKLVRW